ncbi:MAG: 3-isopropylmalate dehydratase [Proteobacteria bacterium]|nr:3-isopropylmalate dehydratase [Pseudomonadota bacterium]
MSLVVRGRAWKFGDDINTDYMAPGFVKNQPWELVKKAILHVHPGFTAGFRPGDVIVAGENFGCGSSREAAPANLKRLEVGCVVAESFGRIFLRNSIAIAFPVLICKGISRAFEEGEQLELDFDRSLVKNLTRGTELAGTPLPPELVRIVAAGGMMQLLKQEAAAAAR